MKDENYHCPRCKYEYTLTTTDGQVSPKYCPNCSLRYGATQNEITQEYERNPAPGDLPDLPEKGRLTSHRTCPICKSESTAFATPSIRAPSFVIKCKKCNYYYVIVYEPGIIFYLLAGILAISLFFMIGPIGLILGAGIFALVVYYNMKIDTTLNKEYIDKKITKLWNSGRAK